MQISALIVWLVSILTTPVLAKIDNEKLDIAQYAVEQAQEQGIDSTKFLKLIVCESGIEKKAKGDFRSETKEYMALGVLQFWRGTWNKYSAYYNFDGEYENSYDQIYLASLMIKNHGWTHWKNCGLFVGYSDKNYK